MNYNKLQIGDNKAIADADADELARIARQITDSHVYRGITSEFEKLSKIEDESKSDVKEFKLQIINDKSATDADELARIARQITDSHVYRGITSEFEKLDKNKFEIEEFKSIFSEIQKSARAGKVEAQYQLGLYYYQGKVIGGETIVEHNLEEAVLWFGKALNMKYGDSAAYFKRAQEEYAQLKSNKIIEESLKHQKELQKKLEEELQLKLEKSKMNKINAEAAKNEFNALVQFAETGNSDALYFLGMEYFNGSHVGSITVVEQDIEHALQYFKKSLANGNKNAASMIEECDKIKLAEIKKKLMREYEAARKNTEKLLNEQAKLAEEYEKAVKLTEKAREKELELFARIESCGAQEQRREIS